MNRMTRQQEEQTNNDNGHPALWPKTAFRPAERRDSRKIAELFRIASDGVADYIWSTLARPGEPLLDVGEKRYAREGTAFSYQNCVVVERGDQVIGMVHRFAMETDPGLPAGPQPDSEPDSVLRPYSELELPGSLYISGMALFPEFRGKGLGSTLLDLAKAHARSQQFPAISLVAFAGNTGAVRLYNRHGFKIIHRRRVHPHPLIHYVGDALLMACRP